MSRTILQTHLLLTSPPILLIIITIRHLHILVCRVHLSVPHRFSAERRKEGGKRTGTASTEDSLIPVLGCQIEAHQLSPSIHSSIAGRRTTHRVHRHRHLETLLRFCPRRLTSLFSEVTASFERVVGCTGTQSSSRRRDEDADPPRHRHQSTACNTTLNSNCDSRQKRWRRQR